MNRILAADRHAENAQDSVEPLVQDRDTPSRLSTRKLNVADLPALIELARLSAVEAGVSHRYSAQHTEAHLSNILANGVAIGVCIRGKLIGVAMFTRIDAGFALLDELESAHIFIHTDYRSPRVAKSLFEAIHQLADATGRPVLLHQVAYFDMLAGRKEQTERVEKLYKRMKFDGPYGITYVCRPTSSRSE